MFRFGYMTLFVSVCVRLYVCLDPEMNDRLKSSDRGFKYPSRTLGAEEDSYSPLNLTLQPRTLHTRSSKPEQLPRALSALCNRVPTKLDGGPRTVSGSREVFDYQIAETHPKICTIPQNIYGSN